MPLPIPRPKDKRRDPVVNDVYRHNHDDESRRVIHVGEGTSRIKKNFEVRVCYSNGGNTNHWISMKSFRRWMKRSKLIHDGTGETKPHGLEVVK